MFGDPRHKWLLLGAERGHLGHERSAAKALRVGGSAFGDAVHERDGETDWFLAALRAQEQPTFYFLHALLPHSPWEFLPSGEQYNAAGIHGSNATWPRDAFFARAAQQHHLLQTGFADRFLGRVLEPAPRDLAL